VGRGLVVKGPTTRPLQRVSSTFLHASPVPAAGSSNPDEPAAAPRPPSSEPHLDVERLAQLLVRRAAVELDDLHGRRHLLVHLDQLRVDQLAGAAEIREEIHHGQLVCRGIQKVVKIVLRQLTQALFGFGFEWAVGW